MSLFLDLDKPVVTALDGSPDVMTIPLCSDIVIAERQVVFDDHHVPLGTVSANPTVPLATVIGIDEGKAVHPDG